MAWPLRATGFAGVVSSWGAVEDAGADGGNVLAGQLLACAFYQAYLLVLGKLCREVLL